jgi:hypothetical protein
VPLLVNNTIIWMSHKLNLSKPSFLLHNKYAQYFVLFLFISSLMGCSRWPVPSTGGYAAKGPLQITYKSAVPNAPFHQRLRTYFNLIQQMQILERSQVRRCYPARFLEMTFLEQQIAQETAAGLLLSADIDIVLLANNIAEVWKYRNVKGCPKLEDNPHWLRLLSRIQ